MHTRSLSVILLVGVCGCGGESSNPATPSQVSTALTGLSITPATDLVRIKASEAFTVTATFSDGSLRAVQASWGSDSPDVATVDSTGRATGMASGQATIFGDYQGQRATRLLRVVPDYHGRWHGDWSARECNADGDWQGACREFPAASLWVMTLALNQDRDAITGTTDFGDDLPGQVSGTIRMSGQLTLGGTYNMVIEGVPLEVTVSDWETSTTDNERMTGRFRLTTRVAGLQGSLRVDGELRIVSKTGATTAFTPTGDGRRIGRALARIVRKP